jgi:Short C-terminal domain
VESLELPGATEPTIADKLRELNELKEASLITEEEYEAKRAELLRRM